MYDPDFSENLEAQKSAQQILFLIVFPISAVAYCS